MEWYWWVILIIIGFIILCVFAIRSDQKHYFGPRDRLGQTLYNCITTCNSFAAWEHWRKRVDKFKKEYRDSTGWCRGLDEALIEAARRLHGIKY